MIGGSAPPPPHRQPEHDRRDEQGGQRIGFRGSPDHPTGESEEHARDHGHQATAPGGPRARDHGDQGAQTRDEDQAVLPDQ